MSHDVECMCTGDAHGLRNASILSMLVMSASDKLRLMPAIFSKIYHGDINDMSLKMENIIFFTSCTKIRRHVWNKITFWNKILKKTLLSRETISEVAIARVCKRVAKHYLHYNTYSGFKAKTIFCYRNVANSKKSFTKT